MSVFKRPHTNSAFVFWYHFVVVRRQLDLFVERFHKFWYTLLFPVNRHFEYVFYRFANDTCPHMNMLKLVTRFQYIFVQSFLKFLKIHVEVLITRKRCGMIWDETTHRKK